MTQPTQDTEFCQDTFACLNEAVQIARQRQIQSADTLKDILVLSGHPEAIVLKALVFWGDYERSKKTPPSLAG